MSPNSPALGSQVILSGTVAAQSTGIPVKVRLTAIDPNNNFQDVANATCDSSGFYTAKWTPPVTGTYVVTATFEGDQYFQPSLAKTTFTLTQPAATSNVSVDEIVQKVLAGITSYPAGLTADQVAQKVLASLPANPTADQIAQAINNQLSCKASFYTHGIQRSNYSHHISGCSRLGNRHRKSLPRQKTKIANQLPLPFLFRENSCN